MRTRRRRSRSSNLASGEALRPATVASPLTLEVRILGGFQIAVDGQVLERPAWRLRKAENLVKLLAATPGHRLHREQILEALWPEADLHGASTAFYQALHFARRALEPDLADRHSSAFLHLEHNLLELRAPGRLWVDADGFEEAAAAARATVDPEAYRRAVGLYAGDLLPDDLYEDSVATRRQHLRHTCLDLLAGLAQRLQSNDDINGAIAVLQRALQVEPASEEIHVSLVRVYALAGMRERALLQYRRLSEILEREVGARPDPATRQLYEDIAGGRFPTGSDDGSRAAPVPHRPVGPGVPLRARAAPRHNLPRQLTSFVGRRREIAEISDLIGRSPLVTLSGAGGSGKTRLALEGATELASRYPHGVWWVFLAPLSEPALVPQAVASALGIREQPGRPVLDTLLDWLEPKTTLLLLDNAERLLAACATFVDAVLRRCPSVRILVTSREALRIEGEVAYPVSPLSLPAVGGLASLDMLAQSEAVRLFVDRAVAALASFRLTEHNAQAVLEICRRVDGIPLAIELAAARVRALSLEQIAFRLDDQVRLLADGRRTGLPRHQTLRATMDWSHDLLTGPEKVLFRRLAVFAGGFTLEAAESVGAGNDLEPAYILDLLASLVLKSLVETEDRGVEIRYRLLEPVRQYALSKLKRTAEEPAIRARHRDFFIALAEGAHAGLISPDRMSWQRRVETEHDNIRAALQWSLATAEFEQAFRLGASMARFWARHGYLDEGWKWLQKLRQHESEVSPVARARMLVAVALLAFEIGDQVEVIVAEYALSVFRETGDRDEVESCLRLLGMIENERGAFDRAAAVLDEAVAIAGQSGDAVREAEALRQRGYVEVRRGEYERGIPYLQRSLELLQQTGARRSVGFGLGHLAQAYLYQGHSQRAVPMLREAIALVETAGQSTATAYFRNLIGLALLWSGDYEAAKAEYHRNLAYSDEIGHRWAVAQALIGFGALSIEKGDLQIAARLLAAAQTFLAATVYRLPAAEEAYVQRLLNRLRASMDPTEFELAWAAGSALTLKQAIQYAASQPSAAARW